MTLPRAETSRRGRLSLDLNRAGLTADAGFEILHTNWADAEIGIAASTPLNKFTPEARGLFRLRFW